METKKIYCDSCKRCMTLSNGETSSFGLRIHPRDLPKEIYPEFLGTKSDYYFCWVCFINAFKPIPRIDWHWNKEKIS